jgi:hypothetical protein
MKLDILAFGAHPDDVELGAAATIAKEISLGNSSALAYASAYFPWFELISIVLLSSITNVKGCSGKVLSVSNKSFAGIATEPSLSLSTTNVEAIVVSKSLADTVSLECSNSNKKLSNIGSVLELLITPPKT